MNHPYIRTGLFIAALIIISAFKSDKPAYVIYTSEGKRADFGDLLKASVKSDIVYFGELHDNPISHWLEYELMVGMHKELGEKLTLGAEMFERDNQLMLDEYISGTISAKSFEQQARLWPNYKTDYKPLVDYAQKNQLKFVATNIPRRYASLVHGKGFEALKDLDRAARETFAPLPIPYDSTLSCYSEMMKMGEMSGHASPNLPRAQAVKDATMGYFIVEERSRGSVVLHFNGAYHSDNRQGILWYVDHYKRNLAQLTISTVQQDDMESLEEQHKGKADFIIVVPGSMTRTY
ncbi:MAG TPA: ChaN family lipoprotein [Bacteroidales bacterium]|nr:ChaN family lipoprotein [Bacteroidales bacterium]HRZ76636.1 ChaN family lipoprotein [Bacteroidales bacterium]